MHIISSIRKQVNRADKKLSRYFNVKNKTVFNHEQDIVHYAKWSEESFPHDYVSKSGRRVLERVKDHNCKDTSFHIFQHCEVADHQFVSCNDLSTVSKVTLYINGMKNCENAIN